MRKQNASMLGARYKRVSCEGLGHAILGNFSTDQMVIELAKIWK